MNHPVEICTERLLLRRWTLADREPFAQLNADPEVNEFLTGPLTREQSDAVADRIIENFSLHGFGLVGRGKFPASLRSSGLSDLRYPDTKHTSRLAWKLAGGWPKNIGGTVTQQKPQLPPCSMVLKNWTCQRSSH